MSIIFHYFNFIHSPYYYFLHLLVFQVQNNYGSQAQCNFMCFCQYFYQHLYHCSTSLSNCMNLFLINDQLYFYYPWFNFIIYAFFLTISHSQNFQFIKIFNHFHHKHHHHHHHHHHLLLPNLFLHFLIKLMYFKFIIKISKRIYY